MAVRPRVKRSSSMPTATSINTSAPPRQENLRITHVTETHIHADYVSGSRELAQRTGATLLLSDEGDKDWKYTSSPNEGRLIRNGDRITLGNVRVDVLATPGHTPEHLTFLITDGAAAGPADCGGHRRLRLRRRCRTPGPARARGQHQGHHGSGRAHALEEPADVQPVSRLAADLARPRRRLRVRQGHQRHPALHARLRAPLQLGLQGEDRGRLREGRPGRPARAAEVLRDDEAGEQGRAGDPRRLPRAAAHG